MESIARRKAKAGMSLPTNSSVGPDLGQVNAGRIGLGGAFGGSALQYPAAGGLGGEY